MDMCIIQNKKQCKSWLITACQRQWLVVHSSGQRLVCQWALQHMEHPLDFPCHTAIGRARKWWARSSPTWELLLERRAPSEDRLSASNGRDWNRLWTLDPGRKKAPERHWVYDKRKGVKSRRKQPLWWGWCKITKFRTRLIFAISYTAQSYETYLPKAFSYACWSMAGHELRKSVILRTRKNCDSRKISRTRKFVVLQ